VLNLVFENNTPYKVDLSLANTIASDFHINEIELILTDNSEIHEINLTTRGIDKPTDVLSFPYEKMPNVPLGSIIISADYIQKYAQEYSHSFQEEFTLLFIHGVLHLLGYDHEIDNGEHRIKEEELIEKYKLPQSLIVRNS
jgi:probable rRNA maturation factor